MFELIKRSARGNNVGTRRKETNPQMVNVCRTQIYISYYAIDHKYNWCEVLVDRSSLKLKFVCSPEALTCDSYKISRRGGGAASTGPGSGTTKLPNGKYLLISSEDNVYIFQHESIP